jgi:hypothetical protein
MIEQMYFTILKSLNVRLDYSSDNLFKIREESQVEQYIGRENYMELKREFNERLRKKYIVDKVEELKFLSPVTVVGIGEGYYLEKDNILGLSEVHYVMAGYEKDYKLYTITKANESIIRSRLPLVGEYDRLFKSLIENNVVFSCGTRGEFVFDIRDEKQEDLLRVVSVQSVYKQYCCYVAIVENSEGQVKKIALQNLIELQ